MKFSLSALLLSMLHFPLLTAQENASEWANVNLECMANAMVNAHESTTIAELKELCREVPDEESTVQEQEDATPKPSLSELLATESSNRTRGVISRRNEAEALTAFNPYVITPHKMNYIMPVLVTDELNLDPYRTTTDWVGGLSETETKIQLSYKVPLNTSDLFIKDDQLFFGFTLKSWWQVYSENISKPFRETNYQPELFYTTPLDLTLGSTNSAFAIGIEHQSNGRSQGLSRSWDRIYLNWMLEYEDFALSFRPWYRLPETRKTDPDDTRGDDNPDIYKYMGYFELGMAYQWSKYEFHFIGHQNFSTSRGGAQLGWTFPISGRLRGYLQIFSGYGESLIDYNHSQNRIGIGIALTDLL